MLEQPIGFAKSTGLGGAESSRANAGLHARGGDAVQEFPVNAKPGRVQDAAKSGECLPANHRQSAERRQTTGKQFKAASNALRRLGLGQTRWQGGQDNAASESLERRRDTADETGVDRHGR